MKPCICCNGSKMNPYGPGECKTCNGTGELTEERIAILRRIQQDLAKRLAEKGIEYGT